MRLLRSLTPLLLLGTASVMLAACSGGAERTRTALAPAKVNTLGVNTFLWRGALETLGFMPMQQVDSDGGVILTDWYVNPQVPGERVRVTVYILDKDLRADAIRVVAQRQENQGGQWVEAAVRAGTVQKLEETILTRARQIRQGAVASAN
jgi:hypothetical protein